MQRRLPRSCRVALTLGLLLFDVENHRPQQREREEAETNQDREAPAWHLQKRVDDDHSARAEGGDARQDKLGAVPEVPPGQRATLAWGDFGRCETDSDKGRD